MARRILRRPSIASGSATSPDRSASAAKSSAGIRTGIVKLRLRMAGWVDDQFAAQLWRMPGSRCDHRSRRLALSPLRPECRRCRGFARRANLSNHAVRWRERQMHRFKSAAHLHGFASVHGVVQNLF